MRKKLILFLILISPISIFACGGCVDASAANKGAEELIKEFNTQDEKIGKIIQEINKNQEEIIVSGKSLINMLNSVNHLNIATLIDSLEIIFESEKENEILRYVQ